MLVSRFLRALLLTCAVFAVSVAPGGWLVCLGADGHLALEAEAGACAIEHSHADSGSVPCSLGNCGPCRDAELGGAALLRPDADRGFDVGLAPVVLPRVTSGLALDFMAGAGALHAQAAPHAIFSRHLQTTLLRC